MEEIEINSRGLRRVLARHPWVYRSDVIETPKQAGIYRIRSGRQALGWAFVNPLSEITVRFFSFKPAADPMQEFWAQLERAIALRRPFIEADPEGGYRLISSEGDGLPGLIIDDYAGIVVMQVGVAALEPYIPQIVEFLRERIDLKGILLRHDLRSRELEGLPSEIRVAWGEVPERVWVREGQSRYLINPYSGHKTGSYLDQRENRLWLAGELARRDKIGRGLDVFSYQGGFALQVAPYCEELELIDSSGPALALARENLEAAGFANVQFSEAEAFELLRQRSQKPAYDLIVLDPPPLARHRADREAAFAAYKELNLRAFKALRSGGILATACCSYHVSFGDFMNVIKDAAGDAHREARILREASQGFDHPVRIGVPETRYLKFVALEVL